MLLLINLLLYIHFIAFLVYLATLLRQWTQASKQVSRVMLYCGITLLLTGIGLVAIRFPVVNYWKVIPKCLLLVIISGITATHRAKPLTTRMWQLLIGMTVLTSLIALWRVA